VSTVRFGIERLIDLLFPPRTIGSSEPRPDTPRPKPSRHHDDPRSDQGMALLWEVRNNHDLTHEELRDRWQQANKLVGQRAPADYGEFLAYGYIEGRRDALEHEGWR
jgi:hypothetical protein